MATYSLGKGKRLKSRKLIERVFRSGKGFSVFPFRVTYILEGGGAVGDATGGAEAGGVGTEQDATSSYRPAGTVQAGFGATRRNFKRAVDRNRIKRLTREAYRLQQHGLNERVSATGKTLSVFFIYTGKELPDQATVMEKMGLILQKLINQLDRS